MSYIYAFSSVPTILHEQSLSMKLISVICMTFTIKFQFNTSGRFYTDSMDGTHQQQAIIKAIIKAPNNFFLEGRTLVAPWELKLRESMPGITQAAY